MLQAIGFQSKHKAARIHQILNANSFRSRYIHTHVRSVTSQMVNVTIRTMLQLTECDISSMEIYIIRGEAREKSHLDRLGIDNIDYKDSPITWTLQMAQVSHSTSQLHIATAFHFFRVNILSFFWLSPSSRSPKSCSESAMFEVRDTTIERTRGD